MLASSHTEVLDLYRLYSSRWVFSLLQSPNHFLSSLPEFLPALYFTSWQNDGVDATNGAGDFQCFHTGGQKPRTKQEDATKAVSPQLLKKKMHAGREKECTANLLFQETSDVLLQANVTSPKPVLEKGCRFWAILGSCLAASFTLHPLHLRLPL